MALSRAFQALRRRYVCIMNFNKQKTNMKNIANKLNHFLLAAVLLGTTSANALTDALKIKIAGNGYTDETVIRFISGATADFDGDYDAWKLFSTNTKVPSIYTKLDSFSQLSINAYPELDKQYSFDLGTLIPAAGNYSISAVELGSFAAGATVMMQDLQTGYYYNLRDTTSRVFSMAKNTNKNFTRFRIVFSPMITTGITMAADTAPEFRVWQSDGQLMAETSYMGKAQLMLFNTLGQLIGVAEMDGENRVMLNPAATGAYILCMHYDGRMISRKFFFNN